MSRKEIENKLVQLGKDVDLDVVYENNIKLVNEMNIEDNDVEENDKKETGFVEGVKNR